MLNYFFMSKKLALYGRKINKETIFACILTIPFVIYAFTELCLRINYELAGVYNWDTTIYWAVGRGILNGIAPWSGLFETKPPGIFFLSAISFKIFNNSLLTHYFQIFVLLLTAAIPIIAFFLLSSYRSIVKLAFSCLAGLLLALYSAERSGEVQVESFGAAFACIAAFAMIAPNFEKILWTSIAAIGILGACIFKEPFLFPLFGISLILCKNIRIWFYSFVLPLIIAVLLGIIILLIFGYFNDFLHYLGFMSSTHIFKYGSPFRRAMNFPQLYNDLNAFSWGLAIALLALLSLPFILHFTNSESNENTLFIKVIFFGVTFFLSSYAVGLGGQYYNHHHILALPFYMALVLLLLKNWDGKNSKVTKLGLVSFIFLIIATLNLPNLNLDERKENLRNWAKEPIQVAAYLDSKMDEFGIERYTFIGYHGPEIYGWTKHSPDGPYFMQYDFWFKDIPGFRDSLISSINRAEIVVVFKMWGQIEQQANQILAEQFTEDTQEWIKKYKIYFRNNKF